MCCAAHDVSLSCQTLGLRVHLSIAADTSSAWLTAAQVPAAASAIGSYEPGCDRPSTLQQAARPAYVQQHSPPLSDLITSVSYEACLANVIVDLDSQCIVVATDDKQAQCIASFIVSSTGLVLRGRHW